MPQHRFCLALRQHRAQSGSVGLLHSAHTAKMLEQSLTRPLAHAGNFQQLRFAVAHLPALAVEGHGKAVRFVANELNQMQHRRVMIERDRILLLAVDIENLFALGDRR